MARRIYTDEERAACLAALAGNGGNVKTTAHQCGVPRTTLIFWMQENKKVSNRVEDVESAADIKNPPAPVVIPVAERVAAILPEARVTLANRFHALAEKLVKVAEDGAKDLGAKDAVIAAGVAIDKHLLLSGKPTSIVETTLTVEDAVSADREFDEWERRRTHAAVT